MARAAQVEEHVHRRPSGDGGPQDRPRAYELQPGGRGHWSLEQLGPEPAEHSDPHRARSRNQARVRRRAGPRADLGGLLTDRAARARAYGRRGSAHRVLPCRRGYSRANGGEAVWREHRHGQAPTAQPLEDGELRGALRKDAVYPGQRHQRDPGGGAGIHHRVLQRVPAHTRVHRSHPGRRAHDRRGSDDVRAGGGWCRT